MQSNGISAELLAAAVGGGQVNAASAAQQAVSMFSATNDATAVSVTPGSTSVAGNKTINKTAASGGAGGMCDEKTVEYLRDLIAEKRTLETNNNNLTTDPENNSNATKSIVLRLLDQGKKNIYVLKLSARRMLFAMNFQ